MGDKIIEAQAKFKAIIAKAKKWGIEPETLASKAESLKLPSQRQNTRIWIIYFILVPFVAGYYLGIPTATMNFYEDWMDGVLPKVKCTVLMPDIAYTVFRPPVPCSTCVNITHVEKISDVTCEFFEERYAYSGRPVVIKDATDNWTARQKFSIEFFRDLYQTRSKNWPSQKCQFFPYQTKFKYLAEFLDIDHMTQGTSPWYVGWSNCDIEVTEVLREHYGRPYFLPEDSENKRLDWIFMGSKGYGAPMHVDNVEYPSWQAQLTGRKKWRLQPPPECYYTCHSMEVIVEPGETIILDTNKWYHSTEIVSDEISITIGAEYD